MEPNNTPISWKEDTLFQDMLKQFFENVLPVADVKEATEFLSTAEIHEMFNNSYPLEDFTLAIVRDLMKEKGFTLKYISGTSDDRFLWIGKQAVS